MLSVFALALSAFSCGEPYQITLSSRAIGAGGGSTTTIRSLQPALAVRGTGCLNCHANIQGNVVTDFGYGNSYYMEQENSRYNVGNKIFTDSYYTPFTWQAVQQLNGEAIVPAVPVPSGLASSANQSIASFMSDTSMTDYYAQSNSNGYWFNYFSLGSPPATLALSQSIVPEASLPAVLASQSIYIGAPSVSQILAIAPNPSAAAPWVQIASRDAGAGGGVTGLTVVQGTSGAYVTNQGTINCSGLDIVINGTLLLNNATVLAESGGCKLYVTGSVFIESPISYANSGNSADPTDNLQITSATAVVMGVGLSGTSYVSGSFGQMNSPEGGPNPLHVRLLDDARNPLFRIAPSSSAYNSWANGVYSEATNIGPNLIQDASNVVGAAATAVSDAGQTRVAINFEHLLINAPMVHSRYLGTFNGVIIAELAEMSLGQFSFAYDSVFSNSSVSVLPALPGDVVCVTNAGGSCNPVMQ